MKKSIFSALCLVLLATTTQSAWGAETTATFGPDWNSLFGTSYTGAISSVKANSLTLTGTRDGVTITIENGTSTSGYVKSEDLRAYNNYTITFSSSNAITRITTIKGGKTFTTGITANVGKGSISNNAYTWTGNANTIVLSISGTVSFSSITVTYSEKTTLYLGQEMELFWNPARRFAVFGTPPVASLLVPFKRGQCFFLRAEAILLCGLPFLRGVPVGRRVWNFNFVRKTSRFLGPHPSLRSSSP